MNYLVSARLLVVPIVFISASCGSTPAAPPPSPPASISKDARLHIAADPASTGVPLPIWQATIDGHELTIATWSKAEGNSACVAPLVAAMEKAQSAWLSPGESLVHLTGLDIFSQVEPEEDEIFEKRVSSALITPETKEKWSEFLTLRQAQADRISRNPAALKRLSPVEQLALKRFLSVQLFSMNIIVDTTSSLPDWTKCIDATTSHHPIMKPIALSDNAKELVKKRIQHQLSAQEMAHSVIASLRTSNLEELGIPSSTESFSVASWEKRHPDVATPVTTPQRREAFSNEFVDFMLEKTKLGSSVFAVEIEYLLGDSGVLQLLLERGVEFTQVRLDSPVQRVPIAQVPLRFLPIATKRVEVTIVDFETTHDLWVPQDGKPKKMTRLTDKVFSWMDKKDDVVTSKSFLLSSNSATQLDLPNLAQVYGVRKAFALVRHRTKSGDTQTQILNLKTSKLTPVEGTTLLFTHPKREALHAITALPNDGTGQPYLVRFDIEGEKVTTPVLGTFSSIPSIHWRADGFFLGDSFAPSPGICVLAWVDRKGSKCAARTKKDASSLLAEDSDFSMIPLPPNPSNSRRTAALHRFVDDNQWGRRVRLPGHSWMPVFAERNQKTKALLLQRRAWRETQPGLFYRNRHFLKFSRKPKSCWTADASGPSFFCQWEDAEQVSYGVLDRDDDVVSLIPDGFQPKRFTDHSFIGKKQSDAFLTHNGKTALIYSGLKVCAVGWRRFSKAGSWSLLSCDKPDVSWAVFNWKTAQAAYLPVGMFGAGVSETGEVTMSDAKISERISRVTKVSKGHLVSAQTQ